MGFLLGFIIGLVVSPLILAAVSKPLMKWFVKRQASKLMQNVAGKLSGLQEEIQITDEDGTRKENSEGGEDVGSEGASSPGS